MAAQAVILDGDALAGRLRARMKDDAIALLARGIVPKLATVLVGEHGPSLLYIGRKHKDCAEIGIAVDDRRLPAATTQQQLLAEVAALNADTSVHGFMVQLPLPSHIEAEAILEAITPQKDIDGLHPFNLGRFLLGRPGLLPCTAVAVLELLRAYDIALAGRRVAIIGRGMLVGRPLAVLLSRPGIDAEVTLLHSRSPYLSAVTRSADVVISAVGRPDLVRGDMIKPGAVIVGVGISYVDGQMVSDLAADVAEVAGALTPRHGSVGALSRAMLLRNLLLAAADRGA